MRSRLRDLIGSVARGILTSAALVTGSIGALVAWAGAASAGTLAQTPSGVSASLLGPVGLGAVCLGTAGMVAGLARRRRESLAQRAAARRRAARARAAQYAHPEDHGTPLARPALPPLVEQPTRRIEPVEQTRAA